MYYDDRYTRRPGYPSCEHDRMVRDMYHLFPRDYTMLHPIIIQVILEMDDIYRYPIPPAEVVQEMEIEIKRRIRYQTTDAEEFSAEQLLFSPFFGTFLTTALLFNLIGRRTFLY